MKKPYWIILGPEKSWETAFSQHGIWGTKEMLYPEWKALDRGDIIFFYVTKTVRGVIGVGKIETKFVQDKPLWPDEIAVGKVIYPFRFEFHVDYLIEPKDWKDKKIPIGLSIQEMRRGINLLQEKTIKELCKSFKEKFNYTISATEEKTVDIIPSKTSVVEKPSLNHSQLQELVFEIGQLNRLISEKEYPMENERLDVVWRRIEKSVPTYVFEIQIGGDVYHALGKLKHAYDLWNSNIFLIAREEDLENAKSLLSGTFHEIQDKIKKITIKKIHELYEQKHRWIDIEREVGLL
ncbi:MAG: hypothetical protein AB1393_03930 [Candidatus Edwardsbacteria bacterium]